ncbi:DUF192 domain-containing protein [Halomarina oriensis]|uniref:DUF192 domain-containing protein n=1 Tax=Halomarina oriensis TaxID=671145 RepID=A0A6B0GGX4_9EURY|nr:DUF192 domain-containing protein [Halomarina oriensis]MWG33001.1 DUF192 domain-containing protein [Halomarina oriensis]
MSQRSSAILVAVVGLVAVLLLGYALYPVLAVGVLGPPTEYDRTTVTAYDGDDGERLGSVDARVADDRVSRYAGLSYTENLSDGEGMWFVHADADSRTFVMRGMSFDIDIVFVSANGTITTVHHAEAPVEGQDGESLRYSGEGKYVLELPADWTTRHDVSVGDCLDATGYETTCAA